MNMERIYVCELNCLNIYASKTCKYIYLLLLTTLTYNKLFYGFQDKQMYYSSTI